MLKNKQLTIRVLFFASRSFCTSWNQAAESFPVSIRFFNLTWSFWVMNSRETSEQMILTSCFGNLDFDAEFLQRRCKSSQSWETIGRKSIGLYLRSCAKAFGNTSEKNTMSWIGDRFEFWFCSFDKGKDSLALPQEKYQKLFKGIIKAFEASLFLMFFLQKSKKMLLFCFSSTWENRLGLWDKFCTWSIFFSRHNLFLIHKLPTKF